jgi:pyruvate kinase
MRKTKIIATLGPRSIDKVKHLSNYVDIFRLNFAHGDEKTHKLYFDLIKDTKKEIPILVDLPGPKIRIGDLKESILLKQGDRVIFSQKEGLPVEDPKFFQLVKENTDILIADGNIKIKITKVGNDFAEGYVIEGGILTSRKGINIPKINLDSGITKTDLLLLDEALKLGADYIGISFVLSEKDVLEIKKITKEKAWVISKIEKVQAIRNLRKIIYESDGVMIARGDLGLEIGLEKVPFIQKRIIKISKLLGKPVILATQVLESMVNNPMPTRAEVTDITNALIEGVDAILLTDETAEGNYPIEASKFLSNIINYSEKRIKHSSSLPTKDPDDAIAFATINVADISKVKIIIVHSRSGNSILRVSRLRPSVPIIGICPSKELARKLKICYGVIPFYSKRKMKNINEIILYSERFVRKKFRYKGRIVITGGDPVLKEGRTDFIKLHEII